MPRYQMIATDLDGTLLDSVGNVSPENDRAMRELTKRGVFVVPSSGRALSEMPAPVLNLSYLRYLSCSDGALIYDRESGETYHYDMEGELWQETARILFQYDCVKSVHYHGVAYVDAATHSHSEYIKRQVSPGFRQFYLDTDRPLDHFRDFCFSLEAVQMVCPFFAHDEDLVRCGEELRNLGGLVVSTSHPHNLEIFSEKAGKGSALLHLAERLGIPKEETVAVGDSPNDTDMILKAGVGLATANGYDELKKDADRIICSNQDHVMAYILENMVK